MSKSLSWFEKRAQLSKLATEYQNKQEAWAKKNPSNKTKPNMQLLVKEDIVPYNSVNFNTPGMIDVIVDDINQKRID